MAKLKLPSPLLLNTYYNLAVLPSFNLPNIMTHYQLLYPILAITQVGPLTSQSYEAGVLKADALLNHNQLSWSDAEEMFLHPPVEEDYEDCYVLPF